MKTSLHICAAVIAALTITTMPNMTRAEKPLLLHEDTTPATEEKTMDKPMETPKHTTNILKGIPPMWYGNPSAVCYVGSVMRLMEHIGDPVTQEEVIALSGTGLCFPWRPGTSCDEVGLVPEIPARTFDAFGYESQHLTGAAVADKAVCLEKIKASIDRGRPVIGFGITHKYPMACLITGYDENGLYTRSFWPPEGAKRDAEEYFYSTDWHDKCAGLLFVGDKTGARLTGAAAYGRIVEWARNFRWERNTKGYAAPAMPDGKEIYLNGRAFDEMAKWLLDDAQWQNPAPGGGEEQFLMPAGLRLLGYYRAQLLDYLRKLDAQHPGVVHKPVFSALERITAALPAAAVLETVDPALKDFSAMRDRATREKVAHFVRMLGSYDDSVQWTLFMPGSVKDAQKGFKVESFEYLSMPAMRFLGFEGEEYKDVQKRLEAMRKLDAMTEHKSGFDYDILFIHHRGLSADNPTSCVWGRFMKAGAPVPERFLSIDFVPDEVPGAGPPYLSRFAFAKFVGDVDAMYAREGYESYAIYDITRNIVLGDGVNIPYPEKYWTAEVYLDGCDKPDTAYLFSVGDWPGARK